MFCIIVSISATGFGYLEVDLGLIVVFVLAFVLA